VTFTIHTSGSEYYSHHQIIIIIIIIIGERRCTRLFAISDDGHVAHGHAELRPIGVAPGEVQFDCVKPSPARSTGSSATPLDCRTAKGYWLPEEHVSGPGMGRHGQCGQTNAVVSSCRYNGGDWWLVGSMPYFIISHMG